MPRRRPGLLPCGTVAAARRHLKDREPMCGPCRIAWTTWRVEYDARHRADTEDGPVIVAGHEIRTRLTDNGFMWDVLDGEVVLGTIVHSPSGQWHVDGRVADDFEAAVRYLP